MFNLKVLQSSLLLLTLLGSLAVTNQVFAAVIACTGGNTATCDTWCTATHGGTVAGGTCDCQQSNAAGDTINPLNARPQCMFGVGGNDTLNGSAFADYLDGGNNVDIITGNGGNDTLIGGGGNDTITGNDGNDSITLGGGSDSGDGGAGNDTITGANGDTCTGGDDDDTITGCSTAYGDRDSTVSGSCGSATCVDNITGSTSSDAIYGGAGGDTINGNSGGDIIRGGDGNDSITGGAGSADFIYGEAGDDIVTTGTTADTVEGGDGSDTITTSTGVDVIYGDSSTSNTCPSGTCNDIINTGNGNDIQVYGGPGDDTITGGTGANTLYGDSYTSGDPCGSGNCADTINGGTGNDTIFGDTATTAGGCGGSGTCNDNIVGSDGADTLHGGAGVDTLVGDNLTNTGAESGDALNGNDGDDTIYGDNADHTCDSNTNDVIVGGNGNDTIYAGFGSDTSVQGNAGADIIYGDTNNPSDACGTTACNDTLLGGDGSDLVYGGIGNDTLTGDNATASGAEGADTVQGNAGVDIIYGDNTNGTCTSGICNDTILGGDGSDNTTGLNGGPGNDIISGDNATASGAEGADLINGGDGNDTLYGDNSNNTCSSGTCNDTINGDSTAATAGADYIYGGPGDDTLRGDTSAGTCTSGSCDDLIQGSTGNDTITGGPGNDSLSGENGSDSLSGDAGDDQIGGGSGDTDAIDGGTHTTGDNCFGSAGFPASDPLGTMVNCETFTHAVIGPVELYTHAHSTWLHWDTIAEVGTVGFRVFRVDTPKKRIEVTRELIMANPSTVGGAHYYLRDPGLSGSRAQYEIVEIDDHGIENTHGPFTATLRKELLPLQPQGDVVVQPRHQQQSFWLPGQTQRALQTASAAFTATPGQALPSRIHKRPERPEALIIAVSQIGWQSVSAAVVAEQLGLTLGEVKQRLQSGRFALSLAGKTVAWQSSADYNALEFYSAGGSDGLYSSEALYRLGKGTARFITVEEREPDENNPLSLQFISTVHVEEDLFPATAYGPKPDQDYWFWKSIGGSVGGANATATVKFEVPDVVTDANTQAYLKLTVQGATDGAAANHVYQVLLNQQTVGRLEFRGKTTLRRELAVDVALLRAGTNELSVIKTDQASAGSVVYLDALDVRYTRKLRASNDTLFISAHGTSRARVTNFSTQAIRVLDVTNEHTPRFIEPVSVSASVSGGYDAEFLTLEGHSYWLSTQVSAGQHFWAEASTSLSNKDQGADLVIITRSDLLAEVEVLAQHRRAQGLQVRVVDIEDVYASFSAGEASPLAIKSFLTHTWKHWSVRPRYVLLAGAGHFDYRGVTTASGNLVPPLMATTPNGLFAADGLLADVAGNDAVPEISLGRLSVQTAAEMHGVIEKMIRYETSSGDWLNRILVAAEEQELFVEGSLYWSDVTATGYQVMDLTAATSVSASQRFIDGINDGGFFLHYYGHGGVTQLGKNPVIFNDGQINQLSSSSGYPIISAMSCLINNMALPNVPSVGAQLVTKADGGAIAVLSASGLSNHMIVTELAEAVGHEMLSGQHRRLGDAWLAALQKYASKVKDKDLLAIYQVAGDPSLVLANAPHQAVVDSSQLRQATSDKPGAFNLGGGSCGVSSDNPHTSWFVWLALAALLLLRRTRTRQS